MLVLRRSCFRIAVCCNSPQVRRATSEDWDCHEMTRTKHRQQKTPQSCRTRAARRLCNYNMIVSFCLSVCFPTWYHNKRWTNQRKLSSSTSSNHNNLTVWLFMFVLFFFFLKNTLFSPLQTWNVSYFGSSWLQLQPCQFLLIFQSRAEI